MRKGRLSRIEQTRRLKLLLEFIFIFRYAARYELFEFSLKIIGLTDPRWLIYYAHKRGLIRSYHEPIFNVKIYYLTSKGKDFIYEEEALVKHYRFERKLTGANSFRKHNLLVDSYLTLNRYIDVPLMNWESDWLLRIGKKKRESVPDSVFTLTYGTRIAVVLEMENKRPAFLKGMVSRYRYDIDKGSRYHAVLIMTSNRTHYENLKKRLSIITPDFCQRAFIFADPEMLKEGLCFYKDGVKGLKEAISLLREKGVGTGTRNG